MTEPIAYAALQVIPSLDGVQGAIDGQLTGPLVSSGRSAGRAAGRAVASGLEAARADVARASQALAAARDKEADAAGKIRVAEAKLEELRAKGTASASQLARAEEALATAQRNGARASQARQRAVQDLSDARVRLANTTDDATESEGRFSAALSGLRDRLGTTTKEMAAASAAAAGIGAAMVAASTAVETESLNDKLAAQLGASPKMAQEFGQIAGNLYSQAYGDSLGQVNDALRNVWQQGLVAEDAATAEIEAVTASVLDLSSAFDEDVSAAAAAVGTLLKTGLAPDAKSAMDTITRGFQEGANKGGDLLDTFIEYPALFQALGLSATEATGLLAQGLDAGAFNADKVADALKEFQIRATDGSETSKAAYEALGLSAEEMTAKIAAGGAGAREGLDTVLDRLRAMEDPVARNAAAVGIFGTQAEDLAGALFALDPSAAVDSLGKVDGAATKLGDTLANNTATDVEKVKRAIQTGLGEALTSSVTWIQNNETVAKGLGITLGVLAGALVTAKVAATGYAVAQGIMAASTGAGTAALAANSIALGAYTVATGVIRGATMAWSAVQWVLNAALSANPIGLVVVAIGALVAGIVLAYKNSETFRNIVEGAWNAVQTAISFVWESVLKPFFGWWGERFADAGDIISGLGDKAGQVKDRIVDDFGKLVGFITGLPGKVRSAASGLWDGITDGFKTALNWLISKWNNFRLGFDFTIPVIDKHISFTIDTPDLPMLAGGGVAGRTRAGLLYGPGTGTSDSILGVGADGIPTARVSAGEGVVMKRAMANGGAELVAMLNRGWTPPAEFLHAMVRGGARLAHGDYDGSLNRIGIAEDSPIVAAVLGLRSLLHEGNYTGNLRDAFGVEEDHPLVSAALGGHSLLARGDYDGRLRQFGIAEDNPLVDAAIGGGALLRGDYRANLRRFGIEEDSAIVDAGLGLGGLLRGDYLGNLRRFGIEEDNPAVAAALEARQFLASLPGFAGGGVVPGAGNLTPVQQGMWESLRNAFPEAQLTSATRTVDVGSGYDFHMQGKAIDIAGPNMAAMADWIASNYPDSLELIHGNGFSRNIDEGKNVGDGMAFFGADTMAGHADHIHWARATAPTVGNVEPGAGGGLTSPGGTGGASGAGASSPSVGSGASTGGAAGTTGTRPPGTAVPVWVDNWPPNFGTAASTTSSSSATPGVGGAPTDPAAPAVGGGGVEQHYGAGQDLAATPEQAADPWGEWAKGVGDGFRGYLENNWKEMLNSGLSMLGMGAVGGGGNTYNIMGPDPRQAAMAVERVHRRQAMASMRRGGFGR
ncbi:phage tail tape measure protein [Nocardia cyriacigeorgica]|uniref:phage tail tape measure protein n=1 Tax=Nocardia cyriacigeorgica TaxID=135487 RepID=UPI001894B43B|nr:phage tail tape measure protein [Nocardia cyriacigeorgica]MBF6399787.1 phage tail tape measure protein [Nocardia cyriacigeorgica]MBF6405384.1 phage tail tape measure protein [Nocardia cyriacigeorgica]